MMLPKGFIYLGFGAIALLAQKAREDPSYKAYERIFPHNPNYSAAVLRNQSPDLFLLEKEAAMAAANTPVEKFLLSTKVAQAALEAGQLDKAQALASGALKQVPMYATPKVVLDGRPMRTGAEEFFQANLVLGRIALLKGDVFAAKQYLLLAGQAEGSPNLDGSGPNMTLARELLKLSERDTVVQFLQECKAFWIDEKGRLDTWITDIRWGKMPDFGANLFY